MSIVSKLAASRQLGITPLFSATLIHMLPNRAFPLKAAMPYWAYTIRRRL